MQNTLYLVGLGLCDELDLPLRSIERLKNCKDVFMEEYTNLIREGTRERISRLIGKEVRPLLREDVENEKIILEAAMRHETALIIPGDPMTATTHNSLLAGAAEKGIRAKILHASSIIPAAAGATGLQIYKFGKTATVPFWRKNFSPDSFIGLIENNLKIGAHTLCLLDIDKELGSMRPKDALEILFLAQKQKMERKEISSQVINPKTEIFVASRVGWENQQVWFGKAQDCPQEIAGPAIIVIPANLHFMEGDALKNTRGRN